MRLRKGSSRVGVLEAGFGGKYRMSVCVRV